MTDREPDRREGDPETDFTMPAEIDLDFPSDPNERTGERAEIDPRAKKD